MPYQSTAADRRRAYIVGAVYLILAGFLAVMLFLIWPPIPWPWPAETDKEKARLAAILKDSGCPQPTPSQSPATVANANQPASSSSAGNTNQPSTQSPATATQPAAPGNAQTNSQTTRQPATAQPGTTQQPATGTTQPAAQPANTTGSTTTTPAEKTAEANQEAEEIVTIPMNLLVKCVPTTFDERLLLLVIVVGMLGAFVHGATSLADYLGNNAFNKSWTWFYLLRPAIGMALALVFYFAIRGGFLSTTGGARDINPYGIAALAGMVGMFSKQATDKLGEIFSTLFRSGGDDRREDPLNGSTVPFKLDPPTVVAGGDAFKLTVNGTGFVDGATINVNDNPQPTTFVSATQLTAQIAKETIANAGTLKLTVVNKDQTKIGPVDLVVSAAGSSSDSASTSTSPTAEQPVTGEGGDEDLIDGCDVEMKADTPDEDLPITEGGVK